MRIAFLCKRRYMRHDVIEDRYARLYELPRELARLGHHLLGICLSYREASTGCFCHEARPGALQWVSFNMGRLVFPGLLNYLRRTAGLLTEFKPDVIIGASDSLHVVLGEYFSRRLKAPYAVDLYDNFECFGLTRFPFLKNRYREAVRRADAVFCVSDLLSKRVRSLYRATGRITTIESTIQRDHFKPRNQLEARLRLGLPCDVHLVGTAGALDRSRGIEQLYQAFEIVSRKKPDLHLVLAGATDRKSQMAALSRVHYLGQIKHSQVPDFFGALDVGIICLQNTSFGRYSFPQKAYEMAATRIPLVAAAVGAIGELFSEYPECLYPPGDSLQLAERIYRQLDQPVIPDIPVPTWTEQAKRMECVLKEMR